MYEYRNPVRVSSTTIDVEYNHPRFGWVPFTAMADDPEEIGRWIYEDASKQV